MAAPVEANEESLSIPPRVLSFAYSANFISTTAFSRVCYLAITTFGVPLSSCADERYITTSNKANTAIRCFAVLFSVIVFVTLRSTLCRIVSRNAPNKQEAHVAASIVASQEARSPLAFKNDSGA